MIGNGTKHNNKNNIKKWEGEEGRWQKTVTCTLYVLVDIKYVEYFFDSADLSGAVEYTIPGILRICTVFGAKKSVEITYSYINQANTL